MLCLSRRSAAYDEIAENSAHGADVNDNHKNDNAAKKSEEKWDWVGERSACTYPKIFKDLMLQVEDDVKTRNGLRPQNAPYEFSVVQSGNEFTAVLQAGDVRKAVTFTLGDHSVKVRGDDGGPAFDVYLTFTREGKCSPKVNDEPCDLWQIRRMALEGLFFPSY
jgi:hypothetical protein